MQRLFATLAIPAAAAARRVLMRAIHLAMLQVTAEFLQSGAGLLLRAQA